MNTLLVLVGIGSAAVPGEVLATPGPPDLQALWTENATMENVRGPGAKLACRILVEDLPLCFRVEEGQRRRWVTMADLALWGVSLEELEGMAASALGVNPLESKKVVDGPWHWWSVSASDGREGTLLLHPDWLSVVGPKAVLAVPARNVVFAWNLGDPDLDKIMAVGIRKAHESSEFPVTTKILGVEGSSWVVQGESRSTNPPPTQ